MRATHVVIDEIDGYVFWHDGKQLMDKARAEHFACVRNSERKPDKRTYTVFRLVPPEEYAELQDTIDLLTSSVIEKSEVNCD